MQIAFATCEQQPLITADDQLLAEALAKRGVAVIAVPWTEIDPFAIIDAPPVLLRSTWDYHRKPTLFRSWLDAFANSGRMMWNPPSIARANVDKIYLKTLEDGGIAIPKTRWLERADNDVIAETMREESWDEAVIKPRIAATAYGTYRLTRGDVLADDQLAPARASGALLQEVVPEIVQHGEVSIVYFSGAFSHAVIKRAKHGEFRVQKDFGGVVAPMTPSTTLRDFADRVMATAVADALYARVDVVDAANGPLLMELELIEPELYFLYVPGAASQLADLIAARLA